MIFLNKTLPSSDLILFLLPFIKPKMKEHCTFLYYTLYIFFHFYQLLNIQKSRENSLMNPTYSPSLNNQHISTFCIISTHSPPRPLIFKTNSRHFVYSKNNKKLTYSTPLLFPPMLSLPLVSCDPDFHICLKCTSAQAAQRNGSSQSQGLLTVLQDGSQAQQGRER